jgi:Fe-S-cluster containining protein
MVINKVNGKKRPVRVKAGITSPIEVEASGPIDVSNVMAHTEPVESISTHGVAIEPTTGGGPTAIDRKQSASSTGLAAQRSQILERQAAPETSRTRSEKSRPEEWDIPGTHYNCFNCNAMCCSLYERVAVNEDDIASLSHHLGVSRRTFLRTYTHRHGAERLLNRVPDELLEQTCVFLNQEMRLCGVHGARPEVCRVWPPAETAGRCVYYDVLQFERSFQRDPNLVIKVEVRVSSVEGT